VLAVVEEEDRLAGLEGVEQALEAVARGHVAALEHGGFP